MLDEPRTSVKAAAEESVDEESTADEEEKAGFDEFDDPAGSDEASGNERPSKEQVAVDEAGSDEAPGSEQPSKEQASVKAGAETAPSAGNGGWSAAPEGESESDIQREGECREPVFQSVGERGEILSTSISRNIFRA